MAVVGELLFYHRNGVDLDDILRHNSTKNLRDVVDGLAEKIFQESSDEEIADKVASEMRIEPLEVDFDGAVPKVEETQVEIRDAYGFDRGPIRVAGLRATKTIPFKGDANLWHLRTNPFDMNPPHGEVRGKYLVVGIEVSAQQGDQAAQYIDGAIKSISEYVKRQRAQIEPYNESLKKAALPFIQQRRSRLGNAADLLKKLGG